MQAHDIFAFTRRDPFVPFRIKLSNGTTHEVQTPALTMVGHTSMLIGKVAPGNRSGIYDRVVQFSLADILAIEAIQSPPESPLDHISV
jgi:hypothetical protein